MIPIYLGWDSRETLAYDVAKFSIERRCPKANIMPLVRDKLPMLTRPVERRGNQLWCPISEAPMATEFAISRFCVPFLQTKGWALFADCDILCLADMRELFELADDRYAVMVVKHRHEPTEATKMDGQLQSKYARKNWSSVCLWNCSHPAHKLLTLEALNTWPGRDLHAFKWLEDEEIGELPDEWNVLIQSGSREISGILVGNDYRKPKILHYTLGGQWIPDWNGGPLDNAWLAEQEAMLCLT